MLRSLWHRLVRPFAGSSRGQPPSTSRRPRSFRPIFEHLEDRLTPSTFLVSNSADNLLPGSLRYAINQANHDPGSVVAITSQVTSPIVLTSGQLCITANMTILNEARAQVEIQQTAPGARVFSISGSNGLNVSFGGGLLITGGSVRGADGGGILVNSSNSQLTLTNVEVSGNAAFQTGTSAHPTGGIGGGIYSTGSVTLWASQVQDNQADTGGGGIGVNLGCLTITQGSSVSENSSPRGEGGGISVATGSVVVSGASHVNDNSARDVGGILVGTANAPGDVAVSVTNCSTVNGN